MTKQELEQILQENRAKQNYLKSSQASESEKRSGLDDYLIIIEKLLIDMIKENDNT